MAVVKLPHKSHPEASPAANGQNLETAQRSQFSSSSLRTHYLTIGRALREYEMLAYESFEGVLYRSAGDKFNRPIKHFREAVSFLNAETLQSYFEDLLDLEISDAALFIDREYSTVQNYYFPLIGMLTGLGSGLYTASLGLPLIVALSLILLMSVPCGLFLYSMPRRGARRRMAFAQILAREVDYRRGGGRPQAAITDRVAPLREILMPAAGGVSARIRLLPKL